MADPNINTIFPSTSEIKDVATRDYLRKLARVIENIKQPGIFDYSASTTWNPGSLADGAGETSAGITVTGVALGDFVLVSAPYDLQGITCNGYVSAADTVKIRLQNETTGTKDLASGTWNIRVFKK